jgi:uncharacterized protein YajQ (UPF0234 family)
MPTFDIVSKVDNHEVKNAIDQSNREINTRFDFKGVEASFTLADSVITLKAPDDFQLKQMQDILKAKLAKREVDVSVLEIKDPEIALHEAKQCITIKQGIEQSFAKKIIKSIKESKLKVQSSIQGEQIRVTGKKRDDLQEAIQFLKESKLDQPLQFENFRD